MSLNTKQPSPGLVMTVLIAVQFLFGINYVVSKIVVGVFPPLVWASIRIIISAVIMTGVALFMRRPHPKWSLEFFGPLIYLALLGTIINQGSFLVGLKLTTSTNSSILNTLIPVFTLLVVTLRRQEPLTGSKIFGFISALTGVLVIRKVENFTLSDSTSIGDYLTILNCLSYALFLSFGKKFMEKFDPVWTTVWLFIYGSVGLTLLAWKDYQTFAFPVMTHSLWAATFYAVIGATLLTYFLNFWALRFAKSSQVALYIYLQPVIAAAIAYVWMGEPVTLRTLMASALIFIGMLFGNRGRVAVVPIELNQVKKVS